MHTRSHTLFSYAFSNNFFFLSLLTLPQSLSQKDDPRYIKCSHTYGCGNLILPYPFWGGNKPRYCGRDGFEVTCLTPDIISIRIASQTFTLVDIDPSRVYVKMVRADIPSYDNCSFNFTSTPLDSALFTIYPNVMNITLFYDCVPGFSIGQNNFTCRDEIQKQGFFVNQTQLGQFAELSEHCRVQIQVPVIWGVTVDTFGGIESLKNALDKGFDVQYEADRIYWAECIEYGGICGSVDGDGTLFNCHCRNGSYHLVCPVLAKNSSIKMTLMIGFASGAIGAILICIAIFCCKAKSLKQKIGFWKTSKANRGLY